MTKGQLERKYVNLQREVKYYSRVYPKSEKLPILKSMYRHYKKIVLNNAY